MAEFDKKAATWDDDPIRVDRANVIAARMANVLDLSTIGRALEYGSGTGLLSFALKDDIASLVLMDQSKEMIEVAKQKCKKLGVEHLEPMHYDILKQPLLEIKFDLVFILLTLHHIDSTEAILNKFNSLLNPGGYLAIIDLVKEDGSFHEGNTHFHNGFERSALEDQLRKNDFELVSYEICYELEREDDSGCKKYPLFLLVSRKL